MATRTIPFLSATPRPTQAGPMALWGAVSAMIQARRTRQQLAEMEPRMLADIGLSRSDAQLEAGRAFWDGLR